MTNREMINKLSDEELVRYLDYDHCCPAFHFCGRPQKKRAFFLKDCYLCWVDWLKEQRNS